MTDEQTTQLYHDRGFSKLVGFGEKPGLIVVDFVTGFTDPACPLGGNYDNEVEATRRLLEAFRAIGAPVVFTTVVYDDGFEDAGWFIKKVPSLAHLHHDSPWIGVDPRLAPKSGEHVVVKKFASAFFGTNVASLFTGRGCDTLLVTGVTTSGCVRATAVDSLQNGFRTIVVREAVGDRAPGPHEANLFDLHAKYADVVGLDEALAYMNGLAAARREPAAARS